MVILQYRPPVEATCVEFPAGLIDDGETPEQAAVRELKEETGYEGKVRAVSPMLSNQPGMTNANMQVLDCSPTIVADPGLTNANMQVQSPSSHAAWEEVVSMLIMLCYRWSQWKSTCRRVTKSQNSI